MPVTRRTRKMLVAAAIAAGCAGLNLSAFAADLSRGFYDGKAQGWFWYEDPPILEEPEPEPEPEPMPPAVVVAAEPEAKGPPVFSTAWLRAAMPKYLELAIDEPTVENVRTYMYMQRIMMDRAERFAQATQRTVMGDPFLDESVRRPLASFAVAGMDEKAGQGTTAIVRQIAQSAGLFFFFDSTCQLCELQAPLIKNLQDHLGFAVVPVSLDGKNLRGSPWQTFRTDNGQAQLLNVRSLPAIYLASADGEFELVGQSAYSLPELKDRILLAARRRNWISQEEFNLTRPIGNYTNIAEILDAGDIEAALQPASTGIIPSSRLMQYIDSKLELPE